MGGINQKYSKRKKGYIMLRIIAKNIKSNLSKHIKGNITCKFIGNTLIVDIFSNNLSYRYTKSFRNLDISYGLNSIVLADEIIRDYTLCVKKQFFK